MEPQARKQAAGPLTGPFAGVPFLIKDAFHDYAGLPTSLGSRAFANVTAPAHANVVRRYLGAGLVIFGKTNLPELALKAVTELAPVRPRLQSLGPGAHARRVQRRRRRGGRRRDRSHGRGQ